MLGDEIKKLRMQNGLTQSELAAKLFVTRQAVSKWEKNASVPDIEILKKISLIFDVSIDSLINEKPSKADVPSKAAVTKKKNNFFVSSTVLIFTGIAILLTIIILSSFIPAQIKVITETTADDIIMLTPGAENFIEPGAVEKVTSYQSITGNVICFINTYYLHLHTLLAFGLIIAGIYKKIKERCKQK